MRVGLDQVTAAAVAHSHSNVNQYIASALQSLEAHLPVEEQLGPADLAGVDLAGYLRRRGWLGKSAGRLVLIFDQFEEILTVNPNDRNGKRAFFEHIGELLREPDDGQPIWSLFSMREDTSPPSSNTCGPYPPAWVTPCESTGWMPIMPNSPFKSRLNRRAFRSPKTRSSNWWKI